ncbi:DUF222 domain-containing protein [Kribbella sp. NPDC051587]|uniref:HNH endonuclease signature motif containing protein n=1 Tax=Kribbella sp. NPDC051587 TaxID=3364119 RepID=UPI00379FFB4A
MDLLGARPAWSMSGSEALADIDSIDAEIARLETARVTRIARVDETGHAEELGARTTAELLTLRYRMDPHKAHGLVRFARALPKYAAVLDALPNPSTPVPIPDGTLPPEVPLSPERAAVIVSMLEKVPDTVPLDNLRVAEQQLVKIGRDMAPAELRKAAHRARDILDQDGPEPAEQKAYARERLTLIPDDHGVRIYGYLANDNAELLTSTIHTLARPHRTPDGQRDPRSAEKRRADALSTTVRIATTTTDAAALHPTPNPTTTTAKPAPQPTTTPTTRNETPTPNATTTPDASPAPDARTTSTSPTAADARTKSAAPTSPTEPDARTAVAAPDVQAASTAPDTRTTSAAPTAPDARIASAAPTSPTAADARTGAAAPDVQTASTAPGTRTTSAAPTAPDARIASAAPNVQTASAAADTRTAAGAAPDVQTAPDTRTSAAPDVQTALDAPTALDARIASAAPNAQTASPAADTGTTSATPDMTTRTGATATSDPAALPPDSAGSASKPDANARADVDADTAEAHAHTAPSPGEDLPADTPFNGGALFDADTAFDTITGCNADTGLSSETGGGAAVQAERCATVAATSTVGPVMANNWVPGFGAKATLVVTIDWQDLKNPTANSIADTVFGAGLSASTARMLACDAKIIPVVLGSQSEPLDVGRCERLVTKGMRHALNTRDRGCVVCGAPPVMCDARHLISWIDGGITAVSNLVLLCRIHHVDLHAGKWTVTITNGQAQVARPSWAEAPSRRRQISAGFAPRSPSAAARADAAACASGTNDLPTRDSNTGQPSAHRLSPDRSSTVRPGTDQPTTAQLGTSQPSTDQPTTAQLGSSQPSTDRSSMDQLGTDQLGTDRSGMQQLGVSQPGVNQRGVDECGVNGVGAADGSGWSRAGSGEGGGDGEGSVLAATDIRAATRAIWGEDLPPDPPRRLTLSETPDFDPWGEADEESASPPCVPR